MVHTMAPGWLRTVCTSVRVTDYSPDNFPTICFFVCTFLFIRSVRGNTKAKIKQYYKVKNKWTTYNYFTQALKTCSVHNSKVLFSWLWWLSGITTGKHGNWLETRCSSERAPSVHMWPIQCTVGHSSISLFWINEQHPTPKLQKSNISCRQTNRVWIKNMQSGLAIIFFIYFLCFHLT